MRKTNMGIRRFAALVLSVLLFVQAIIPIPVEGRPKIPSPSAVAKEIEQRYNINLGSIQDFGQSFNVANQKKTTPEVSIFFSPVDPREGQKITAKAFPMFFSNESSQLYYTWYLKRKGCDLGLAAGKPGYCNADGAENITVNDWKVAAAQILATDGADRDAFDYSVDADSDGFKAEYGGGNKVNTSGDWCYLADQNSGTIYELVTSATRDTFSCSSGYTPSCVSTSDTIEPGTIYYDPYNATSSSVYSSSSTYEDIGAPSCKDNSPSCPSGTVARCVLTSKINSTFNYSTDTRDINCTSGSVPTSGTRCSFHLFPWPNADKNGIISSAEKKKSGDGLFGRDEEDFWGTNPKDPSTADNGNRDEANVVGLGRDAFVWNYQAGDMLGLVVEGTSMIPTKHDDASSAIMWAFSRNNCNVEHKSSYSKTIRGYSVKIPTTAMNVDDVNACLDGNLIDPLESGQGSSKKLELDVSATPDNPTNDATIEKGGDIVTASVSITNSSRPQNEILYEWTVFISDNPNTGWMDITDDLKPKRLLQVSKGNGLDSLSVALNMQGDFLTSLPRPLESFDTLYLKLAVEASENFSSGVSRSGTSDVIVRVSNTTNKIVSYSTKAEFSSSDSTYKVYYDYDSPICNNDFIADPDGVKDVMQNLNRIACRVMKNEIIGLKLSEESGFSNFQWTLNGSPITCSDKVSNNCGNGVFFAVAGDPGETYTIKVDAVDISSGKSVTLARTFQIVEPEVVIESNDQTHAWPKYVGSHTDLDGRAFAEYSDIAFETKGSPIKLKARFLPKPAEDVSRRVWMIDGVEVPETPSDPLAISYTPATPKAPGEVYNVSFYATLLQPTEKRKALKDIWGIDTLKSDGIRVSKGIQLDVVEPESIAQGPKKFFAAISSYLPASILFAFKITLSMALLLFTVGFVFALIPAEPRTDDVILSRRRE